jgi:hypothetical protein
MPPLVLDGSAGVSGVDGTASNPSYEGTDSNTGIFFPAADTVAIGTGGTERLRVDSSGNVGIATTSPDGGLDVEKQNSYFGDTTNGGRLYFRRGVDGSAVGRVGWISGSNVNFEIANDSGSGNILFQTNSAERMRIDSSGNVGIGTSSPSSFSTYRYLDLVGGGTSTGGIFQSKTSNGAVVNTLYTTGSAGAIGTATNHPLQFLTNDTERARITSGGYFKATSTGTYSAGTTGAVHEFDTSSVDGTIVNFYNQAASNPNGIYVQYTAADPNDATRYVFGAQQNTGVWIYRIYSNGTVAARSDVKWKKNIETTRDGYAEDLAKLRVVKYNWYNHEDGTPKELGLIAQEVEQVFPGLVTTDEQTRDEIKTREVPAVLDEEGNEVEPARTEEYIEKVGTGEYSKSIKFSVLPIMLLKAIQEQQAMIEEMKAEIQALKGNA